MKTVLNFAAAVAMAAFLAIPSAVAQESNDQATEQKMESNDEMKHDGDMSGMHGDGEMKHDGDMSGMHGGDMKGMMKMMKMMEKCSKMMSDMKEEMHSTPKAEGDKS